TIVAFLVFSSLFFYSWWNPAYLPLILISMLGNFYLGVYLNKKRSKNLLIVGIGLNLFSIAYFKYAGFFISNVNTLFDIQVNFHSIILPLAISFFTFQQIAYLVDSYRGETQESDPLNYALFITFFPQLIAGPIVHHKEMLPQFSSNKSILTAENFIIGISIFSLGFFKKTVLADGIAPFSNKIFLLAEAGETIDILTAWAGALAYTFQLYFDFSGYSDMAIGLARIFGIILPLNFYSPYKATNISEFWRRWHMTLSRFLRDYIYIPLGGNRKGEISRYKNLFATMLLGGMWHGAGWNFIIWGALHGIYLAICHSFGKINIPIFNFVPRLLKKYLAWLITMIAVVVGWVFFRAVSFDAALNMLQGMSGMNGMSVPIGIFVRMGDSMQQVLTSIGITSSSMGGSDFIKVWLWVIISLIIVLVFPNTQDIFSKNSGSLNHLSFVKKDTFWPFYRLAKKIIWKQNLRWAFISACLFTLGILTLGQVSEFLYFQF
ncbi:MAG: alginate O-acetyltransferase complex protein AlgI, partial [Paraglaciecola sp.]